MAGSIHLLIWMLLHVIFHFNIMSWTLLSFKHYYHYWSINPQVNHIGYVNQSRSCVTESEGISIVCESRRSMPEAWRVWTTLALIWLAAGPILGRSLSHGGSNHGGSSHGGSSHGGSSRGGSNHVDRANIMLPDICSRNPFGTRRFYLDQVNNRAWFYFYWPNVG